MKLLRRGPDSFTQLIDILNETKQNDIVIMLLTTTQRVIVQGNKTLVKNHA